MKLLIDISDSLSDIITRASQASVDIKEHIIKHNTIWTFDSSDDLISEGLQSDHVFVVKQGSIVFQLNRSALMQYEEGDVLYLSPACYSAYKAQKLSYITDDELEVYAIDKTTLLSMLKESLSAFNAYEQLTQLQQLQFLGMLETFVAQSNQVTPGFKRFQDQEIIISEGEEADYVYTTIQGKASVFHNGVRVGSIGENEIFGAIAVLTQQTRMATVKADGDCMVMMVHRDEFFSMVHSHPDLFMNLVVDMAKTISQQNSSLAELKSN